MKKEALKNIYAAIFLISLVLGVISIQFNNPYLNNRWISFIMAVIILFLSLLGYRETDKLKKM